MCHSIANDNSFPCAPNCPSLSFVFSPLSVISGVLCILLHSLLPAAYHRYHCEHSFTAGGGSQNFVHDDLQSSNVLFLLFYLFIMYHVCLCIYVHACVECSVQPDQFTFSLVNYQFKLINGFENTF